MTVSDESNLRIDELEKNLHGFLQESFRKHVKDLHLGFTRKEMEAKAKEHAKEHAEMIVSIDRIANLLEGTPKLDVRGNVVGRKGGMAARQEEMSVMLNTIYERTNGGVKVTNVTNRIAPDWTRGQKIAAVGISTTVVLASLPGLVSLLRWIAEFWVIG